MEVHHHAHTSRKKWTHYLWEFLMLFLAVFCGFLAEYQLEHKIEHNREKQYAESLIEDLKADTAMLGSLIEDYRFVNPKVDTFQKMVNTEPLQAYPPGAWYYYGRFGTRVFTPTFQDATLQQLKSSGGLRYFKKRGAANAIAHYDQACRDLLMNVHLQDYSYNEVIVSRNRIFNAYYMNEIMASDVPQERIDSFKQKKFPFLSDNKSDFIQYASMCQLRSYNNRSSQEMTAITLDKAKKLLSILQKEYHLK